MPTLRRVRHNADADAAPNANANAACRYPTLVIFVAGPAGMATCAALLESPSGAPNLEPKFRTDVRVYYKVQ